MKYEIIFDDNKYIKHMIKNEDGKYEIDENNFEFDYLFCYYLKDNNLILDQEKKAEQIKKEQEEASKPSRLDQIEAQSIFTALATDTLLEV